MINSFDNYLRLGKVKKKTPDIEESRSLINKAINRLKYAKLKNIDKDTAAFILEDSYEAVRESAQALMSIKGYKPYSHEATIAFLEHDYKDIFNENEIHDFDRFRQLRNDSIYKAVIVNEDDAKKCIDFSEKIIKKIKGLIR